MLLVQHISRMECMLSWGPPTSKIQKSCTKSGITKETFNLVACSYHLPTVLIPSPADRIGPIVDPHGLSFLTPNSYRDNEDLSSIYIHLVSVNVINYIVWAGHEGFRYLYWNFMFLCHRSYHTCSHCCCRVFLVRIVLYYWTLKCSC